VKGTGRLREIYRQYRDRVAFLLIYIREAHATDGWWLGGPVVGRAIKLYSPQAATGLADPTTLAERRAAANHFAAAVGPGMPIYVDDLDDAVNEAYAAWPTRLYLIDTEGRVAYHGGPGPFGFHPKQLAEAIEQLLSVRP
jgi:hypothetical protein